VSYDKYFSFLGIRALPFYKIWWSFLLCHQKLTFYEIIKLDCFVKSYELGFAALLQKGTSWPSI